MHETCQWEVEKGKLCGDPATSEVTIRDKVATAKVAVCSVHKATYNRNAAALRAG